MKTYKIILITAWAYAVFLGLATYLGVMAYQNEIFAGFYDEAWHPEIPKTEVNEGLFSAKDKTGAIYELAGLRGGGSGKGDIRISKYSRDQALEWIATYPRDEGGLREAGEAIAAADEGVYAVIARQTGRTSRHTLILKYGLDGKLLWTRTYKPSKGSITEMRAAATDRQGNLFVLGITAKGEYETEQLVTIKFSPDGKREWARKYGDDFGDLIFSATQVEPDNEGGAYVGAEESDGPVIISYDTEGKIRWKREASSLDTGEEIDLLAASGGQLFLVRPDYAWDFTVRNFLVLKLDDNGKTVRKTPVKARPAVSDWTSSVLLPRPDGGVFLQGELLPTIEEGISCITAAINEDGRIEWSRSYAGFGDSSEEEEEVSEMNPSYTRAAGLLDHPYLGSADATGGVIIPCGEKVLKYDRSGNRHQQD